MLLKLQLVPSRLLCFGDFIQLACEENPVGSQGPVDKPHLLP